VWCKIKSERENDDEEKEETQKLTSIKEKKIMR
jgi:hypothetical protein